MIRPPPSSTRTDTLFPYTTRFRSNQTVVRHRDGKNSVASPLTIAQLVTECQHIPRDNVRSEEHTSELQSLMSISYSVFCLKKQMNANQDQPPITTRPSYNIEQHLNRHHNTKPPTVSPYIT